MRVKIPGLENGKTQTLWGSFFPCDTVFILVKERKVKPFGEILMRTQFLDKVCKTVNREAIVCHPISVWQAKPAQQENICGIIIMSWDNMSQDCCQELVLKKGNMNTNKSCSHFPDIVSNIHRRAQNHWAQREIKGHLVTLSPDPPSLFSLCWGSSCLNHILPSNYPAFVDQCLRKTLLIGRLPYWTAPKTRKAVLIWGQIVFSRNFHLMFCSDFLRQFCLPLENPPGLKKPALPVSVSFPLQVRLSPNPWSITHVLQFFWLLTL